MQKITSGIVFILIILTSFVGAQDVTFLASAKSTVRVGERFQLVYTLNAEGRNFRPPSFEKFSVLGGPSTSSNSSIQIINGNVTRTLEYSYTYVLQATEEGVFTIPAAEINVEGKNVVSNTLKIQVVNNSSTPQGQQGQQGTSGQNNIIEDIKDDVFIRASASKLSPMQGEQVIVTYKLYYRIGVSSPEFTKEPSFKGFWVNDLLKDKNFPQYKENYNGQLYNVAEIKKVAIFPQQSGKVTLSPLELSCQVQVKAQNQRRSRDPFESFFNDPFFNRYQTVEAGFKSNSISLNIKPLPTTNRPANYSGAVGKFDMSSSIDKTELKTNEAVNLKFTISGTGNVELVDKLPIKFPPDFEVYDPKITKNMNYSQQAVSGRKSFEYLIIPRTPGTFKIEAVKFTFFDLDKQDYVTLSSPEYDITVSKGEGGDATYTYSGANQADIKYIGSDIRHIHTDQTKFNLIGTVFFGSVTFYILIAAPLLLFLLFVFIWKNELKKRSNIALMRNRKATRVAHKRLKQAHSFLKENKQNEFYEEVSQALWGYLSDKFSIPLANLSMDSVKETLLKKEVADTIIDSFISTLNNCEYARFAPGGSQANMENIYSEGVNIISTMEKELRL
ncbi:MAG: BatD family protein [Bacteroidales bacterium]|nr:BatD family protein [Bacteroidales bacterium]MCF8402978.1 BatD family protein [Bacteroidales bacterium]